MLVARFVFDFCGTGPRILSFKRLPANRGGDGAENACFIACWSC